jgi:hypothetical protein
VTHVSAGVKNMRNGLIISEDSAQISAGVKNMRNGLIISENTLFMFNNVLPNIVPFMR